METNQKLDKILEQISDIRIIQAEQAITLKVNTEDLKDHMRRTEQAEERLDIHQQELIAIKSSTLTKKDVYTALGVMGAAISFIVTLLEKFKLI